MQDDDHFFAASQFSCLQRVDRSRGSRHQRYISVHSARFSFYSTSIVFWLALSQSNAAPSDLNEELRTQIAAVRIIFDAGSGARLKKELLRENSGTKVTVTLQKLVLELSKVAKIRVSSLIRNSGHHKTGRAVDVGNEETAKNLLPNIATDMKVAELKIDELIFDAKVADAANDRNKWNYDRGTKHNYGATTLDDHKDHIHFAVKAE